MVLPFKSLSSILGGLENPSLLAGAHSAKTKLQFSMVDNNYFMQSQKWFFCNPLMGCSTPTLNKKMFNMTGMAHKNLQRWYKKYIYGITKMHLLQEDNTQISHVLLQTKLLRYCTHWPNMFCVTMIQKKMLRR